MGDKKTNLRDTLRQARKESGISLLKVLAAAATAVTMALVSSRLTSVLNSLIIVAIVSIGSALVSEFYRILLSVTAEGTKKVIVPIVKIVEPGSEGESGETTLDETALIDAAVDEARALDDTTVLTSDSPAPTESEVLTAESEPEHKKSALRSNQFVQLSLIFGVVSLITVGISYAVARSQGKTDISYNYTTVQQNPIEQLSDEEKEALVQLAIEAAQANEDNSDYLGLITNLETQLEDLTNQNADLLVVIDELRNQVATESEKTAQLEQRIDELQTQLGELQVETPAGTQ